MKGTRIAIYGKGGIGKTTIAVNLALTLANRGKRVLLMGCDPKRDTTRLLLHQGIPTILEKYDALCAGTAEVEDICIHARENLWCCEAGGPKPGVGCAGRGVLIALDLLEKCGTLKAADVVLYDVLGDVVCGGVATPVTRGFTDRIYVVTSGEQSSLLAANNILTGLASVGGQIGGLILNECGFMGEEAYVGAFSQCVCVPVVGKLPYSRRIKLEELGRKAICEADGAHVEREAMAALANTLLSDSAPASPVELSQDALYDLIAKIGRYRGDV